MLGALGPAMLSDLELLNPGSRSVTMQMSNIFFHTATFHNNRSTMEGKLYRPGVTPCPPCARYQ